MDVELLRTFIEVQQTRHFGRAADNLFITQSAVSARIRQLEGELGVRLFMRDRNNIQLTAAGQKLLQHAGAIIASWNRARLDVAVGDDHRLPIAMAAVPNLWDVLVPGWLRLIQMEQNTIALTADILSAESALRRVLDRRLDLGLVFEPPRLPELTVVTAMTLRLFLVSTRCDETLEQAMENNYIYVNWGSDFSHQHAHQFAAFTAPAIRLGMGTAALQLLKHGDGCAYLAESQIRQALADGRLFPVIDAPVFECPINAIYRQDTDRRQALEDLIALTGRIDDLQQNPPT